MFPLLKGSVCADRQVMLSRLSNGILQIVLYPNTEILLRMNHKKRKKAGVVAYKYTEQEQEPLVLIVSARKVKGSWVFPVGGIDPGETPEIAAARECEEESGYCVEIGKKLSPVAPGNELDLFTFFLATVSAEKETWESDRRREWIPLSQAKDRLPSFLQTVAEEAAHCLAQQ